MVISQGVSVGDARPKGPEKVEVTVTGLYSTIVYVNGMVVVLKNELTSVDFTVMVEVDASVTTVTNGTTTVDVEKSVSVTTSVE